MVRNIYHSVHRLYFRYKFFRTPSPHHNAEKLLVEMLPAGSNSIGRKSKTGRSEADYPPRLSDAEIAWQTIGWQADAATCQPTVNRLIGDFSVNRHAVVKVLKSRARREAL